MLSAVLGLVGLYLDAPPGPTIVFGALGAFLVCAMVAVPLRRHARRRQQSGSATPVNATP